MKWCRFQDGDTATYGIIEGDTVVAVSGSPFDVWTRTPKRIRWQRSNCSSR